ncbi:pentapeptide repeat-containing protein [Actinopolyspora halophila]|uniref:pentapeptide repeat-containing protein n=1 Tax=Actinopolyspora halophila TaxID=1850 RepID=UPI001FE00273|nr:pentapeptide repeat-containing protein [Actinopolyspora halophila]
MVTVRTTAVWKALKRARWLLRRVSWSTWLLVAAVVLLVGGTLAWVPLDWSKLLAGVWGALAAWGLFRLPGLATFVGVVLLGVVVAVKFPARPRRSVTADESPSQVKPLRRWLVALAALGSAAAAATAGWLLLDVATQAQDPAQARIDAVRTAMTLGAGLVGMVVLWLTGRKQWLAERSQRHTESTAADKHVTELYTAAAQQLASDKAPVRLAGLYALSRLGQYNPSHRQTIVNLWCAYLRMPYTPPGDEEPSKETEKIGPEQSQQNEHPQPLLLDLTPKMAEAAGLSLDGAEQQFQERQVRLTAQRLLSDHLRPDDQDRGYPLNPYFWSGIEIDLSGATLEDFDFEDCSVYRATFSGAHFCNLAQFAGAQFRGVADFSKVRFDGIAWFGDVLFWRSAMFDGAQFGDSAVFDRALFVEGSLFGKAQFRDVAVFSRVEFFGSAVFDMARFYKEATFRNAVFCRSARFVQVEASDVIDFEMSSAWLNYGSSRGSIWPPGWTTKKVPYRFPRERISVSIVKTEET